MARAVARVLEKAVAVAVVMAAVVAVEKGAMQGVPRAVARVGAPGVAMVKEKAAVAVVVGAVGGGLVTLSEVAEAMAKVMVRVMETGVASRVVAAWDRAATARARAVVARARAAAARARMVRSHFAVGQVAETRCCTAH